MSKSIKKGYTFKCPNVFTNFKYVARSLVASSTIRKSNYKSK